MPARLPGDSKSKSGGGKRRTSGSTTTKKRRGGPGLPSTEVTTKPNINFGKMGRELGRARREGKRAAGGQLGTISDRAMRGINRQERKFDAESRRVVRNIRRIERGNRRFQRDMRRGIEAETQHQLALGGAMASGITGARGRTQKAAARGAKSILAASERQAKATSKAGQGVFRVARSTERQQDRASLSILDVLAAERKSEDKRFLQGLRFEAKMAVFQAELQKELALFQNQLPLGVAERQQMKLDFKLQKRLQDDQQEAAMEQLEFQMSAEADKQGHEAAPAFRQTTHTVTEGAAKMMEKYNQMRASGENTYTDAQGNEVEVDWEDTASVSEMLKATTNWYVPEDSPAAAAIPHVADMIAEGEGTVSGDQVMSAVLDADQTGLFRDFYQKNPDVMQGYMERSLTMDKTVEEAMPNTGTSWWESIGGAVESVTPRGIVSGAGRAKDIVTAPVEWAAAEAGQAVFGEGPTGISAQVVMPSGEKQIKLWSSEELQELQSAGATIHAIPIEARRIEDLGLIVSPFGR